MNSCSIVSIFGVLLQKEFLIAVRSADRLAASMFLAFIIALMLTFGVSSTFLGPRYVRVLSPTLVWSCVFIIAAVLGERGFDSELKNKAFEGVVLSRTSLTAVFFSKVFITFLQLFISLILVVLTIDGTLATRTSAMLFVTWPVVFLTLFSFSCLTVLIGGATAVSQLRSVLFPTLLLPNVFPLYLACIELTNMQVARSQVVGVAAPTDLSFWWLLLILTASIHGIIGALLYPFVVKG